MKKRGDRSNKAEVLEYQVNIAFDPKDKIYVARVPELDNCHTHGSTPEFRTPLHCLGEPTASSYSEKKHYR